MQVLLLFRSMNLQIQEQVVLLDASPVLSERRFQSRGCPRTSTSMPHRFDCSVGRRRSPLRHLR